MKYTNKAPKALLVAVVLFWHVPAALAGEATVVGTATASARSSTWIAVEVPLTGDDNGNGYTMYELGTSSGGPFNIAAAIWNNIPGPPEWRANVFARGKVMPNATYFVKVTYVDPDGVVGPNPQIVGPITTPATASNKVTVEAATAVARDTEIFVSVPIRDDANTNSFGTIDIATSPTGPWVRKAGSTFDRNLPFHPKRARIRSLTPGTDYWVRVTIIDPDGVAGSNPQIIGPIRYSGLQNLAQGKPITADPGWGCCPNPAQLVDGRIQNDAWYFGFAWRGGTRRWADGPLGWKHASVDLGTPRTFNRAAMWYHDPGNVPTTWKVQYSNDGSTWTDAFSTTTPMCRTATLPLPGAWYHPACGHDATFTAVTARYVRFTFDDRTLFGGIHGWAVEFEVFETERIIEVPFDIKPQSCPNPLNTNSKGVLPVAILGTEDFDVNDINVESILLEGVSPIRSDIEDVSTPVVDQLSECDCTTEGADDFADLTLKFKTQDVVAALGPVNAGDQVVLTLTGKLIDGTSIEGKDCILVISKGKGKKGSDLSKVASTTLPESFLLEQNYPNPFNPETEIRFQLPEASYVVVRIFNTIGQEIRRLANARYETGYHSLRWDGKDNNGQPVSSGIYFYQLRAGEFSQIKKMSLLR